MSIARFTPAYSLRESVALQHQATRQAHLLRTELVNDLLTRFQHGVLRMLVGAIRMASHARPVLPSGRSNKMIE